MAWLTQFFLNPSFLLPGAALVSVPVIIHLLSRMRYRKVRFAAMEFLLQSDELNRRRLIIEQLLLLLLRILAVILITLLLAKLVLDPSRMMMLGGSRTHHVLIIDDSLSMRETVDEQRVFDQAITTVERILSQTGGSFGSLQATVLTMSGPDRPLVTDRELNNALIQELNPRLRNLNCTWNAGSPSAALESAFNILSGDGGVSPQVHVLTDLRRTDWAGQPEVAEALERLGTIDAQVNLIQVTKDTAPNVALTQLSTQTLATAVGVPWRMDLTFHNFGTEKVSGLRASVYLNGNSLPAKVLVPDIDGGADVGMSHDIVFDGPGQHSVEVRLEQDALTEDNSRYVVVDVTTKRTVLIIDDDGSQEDAGYVAAALGADQLAAEVRQSGVLVSEVLDKYDFIYLLNIRELPADAVVLLTEYVSSGGGVAWFPDDQANTVWYSTLQKAETPLFPVQLSTVAAIPETGSDEDPNFERPVFESHPVFQLYTDTPLADDILVRQWFQILDDEAAPDERQPADLKILARLSNGAPVVFEHAVGDGKVLTFLTTAGRRWSNWPVLPAAPGFVVMNLLMHQYLQKPTDLVELRDLGDAVRFEWPVTEFTETVEVFLPASEDDAANSFLRLQAAPVAAPDESDEGAVATLGVSIPQADRPGVYRIRRFGLEGDAQETWLALSVPITESDLTVAEAASVEQQVDGGHVHVIEAEVAAELSASEAGRELRWILIGLLIAILVAEQLLSLRLSFHPEVKT